MTVLVKYGAGNIGSVLNALDRLGEKATLSSDPEVIRNADRVIFPGVGEASTAYADLKKLGLTDVLRNLKQPFLGICLGMQLMSARSEEGPSDCLGIFPYTVKRFPSGSDKIPHMGWNTVSIKDNPLFEGLSGPQWAYFVHSYYFPFEADATIGCTDYAGIGFSAVVNRDNFFGCQFHPEKSSVFGEAILRNFLGMREEDFR